MTSVNMDGFEKNLKRIAKRVESLGGTRSVRLDEQMPSDFIQECTGGKFSHINDLLKAYPKSAQSEAEVLAIFASDKWNAFIAANTSYSGWNEMQADSAKRYWMNEYNKIVDDA